MGGTFSPSTTAWRIASPDPAIEYTRSHGTCGASRRALYCLAALLACMRTPTIFCLPSRHSFVLYFSFPFSIFPKKTEFCLKGHVRLLLRHRHGYTTLPCKVGQHRTPHTGCRAVCHSAFIQGIALSVQHMRAYEHTQQPKLDFKKKDD